MNFDKKLLSSRQAVLSILIGLFILLPFSYAIEGQLKYPSILLLTMIILSSTADLLPKDKDILARRLRIISFVLAVIVLLTTLIFMINKFISVFA